MKTFYGYALASDTEDQDVLLGQSARIEAAYHASYESYAFGGVLLDPGVTSVKVRHNHLALAPLASRPAGMRLLQAAGQGDMVLATSLLRLFSRAPDLKHVLQIWGGSKIRIVSLEDNFSSDDPDEIMDAFRAAHNKQKTQKIKARQAERRARRKPDPKPRPKDMRQRNGKSVYLDRSIENYLGGGGSRVYQDACWCWARHLERNTAAVEGMFSQVEWQVMAQAVKGQEWSFDPAWPDTGHVLAMWVERALARANGTGTRMQDRLRGLSWSEAWAVIWALQYRLANNIKPTEPGWWSLTYREKQVVQTERKSD